MSTYLYAFAVYDQMHSIEVSKDEKNMLPEIEIIFSEQMGKEAPNWMKTETVRVFILKITLG